MKIADMQANDGRKFVFEHPVGASSWGLETVRRVASIPDVYSVDFDFCELGMTSVDEQGEAPAKKRTRILTNSQEIAQSISRAQCSGTHRHVALVGGRASACQVYPDMFCDTLCAAYSREERREARKRRDIRLQNTNTTDVSGTIGAMIGEEYARERREAGEVHEEIIYSGESEGPKDGGKI